VKLKESVLVIEDIVFVPPLLAAMYQFNLVQITGKTVVVISNWHNDKANFVAVAATNS
jgi:hypothetical protein